MTKHSRRDFLRRLSAGGAMAAFGTPSLISACSASEPASGPTPGPPSPPPTPVDGRYQLRLAPQVAPSGLTLTAAPGTANIGSATAPAWMLNGSLPSPLLRVRRGDAFRVTMRNQLPQELILHWHGLTAPEAMDGHPRLAVPTGGSYEYSFTVPDRAGAYWYHSHTHMRTGEHTYRGIAGLLLVNDAEEDALRLPSGERELPLILQDRRLDGAGLPVYNNAGPAMMAGVQGPEPFVNGVHKPFVEVDTALYRLRLLNGSNARIFRLARSDGQPFVLIGNDGGLLPQPVTLTSLDLAPAERADVLLDLRALRAGDQLMLVSSAFTLAGGMGFMGGANLQGQALDLLEFRVTRQVSDGAVVPTALPPLTLPDPSAAVRERRFVFESFQMTHTINGREFSMTRDDVTVPFGDTEIWTFENASGFPHPVHLHATHFRVLSRVGGRGQVMPWEAGGKDTVLLHPFETVRVAVRFTAQRGLFLLHCHNLEHEDMGMMQNIRIV
jgi:FtsP/CotA-like multicopper oxidase with cupredoxin domain